MRVTGEISEAIRRAVSELTPDPIGHVNYEGVLHRDEANMNQDLLTAIRRLVADLAAGRFDEIERDGRAGRCAGPDLERAVTEYGRTLLPLPDDAHAQIDVVQFDHDPTGWAVDVELWTVQEGRSDLTLSLNAWKESSGYRLEITNLHVL